jgi:hypothetical protein
MIKWQAMDGEARKQGQTYERAMLVLCLGDLVNCNHWWDMCVKETMACVNIMDGAAAHQ